jgi:hypothetical protein
MASSKRQAVHRMFATPCNGDRSCRLASDLPLSAIFDRNVHFTRVSDLVGRDDLIRQCRWLAIATALAAGVLARLR